MNIFEEKVRWRSKRKYPCKRGKGQHEWGKPVFIHEPRVRYIYDTGSGTLDSHSHKEKHKFLHARISSMLEVRCIHCNKKEQIFIDNKIK